MTATIFVASSWLALVVVPTSPAGEDGVPGVGGRPGGTAAPPGLVCVQPLGSPPPRASDVAAVVDGLEAHVGRPVAILPPRPLPAAAYTRARHRYRAERLLVFLRRVKPEACDRILGVATVDISTRKGAYADWGVMGLGDLPGPAAVLSTFRTRRGTRGPAHLQQRVAKLAAHEVGHTLGLPHCPTQGCLMHDAGGRVATLDDEAGYCARCRGRVVAYRR